MGHHEPVPRYFLYGEALQDVEVDFLHVERIATRSRVHDWTIRPHAHPDQHQLLLLTAGMAAVRIEDRRWQVTAPALVAVPAMTVHAFDFEPESDGFVVTAARDFVRRACGEDPDIAHVLRYGRCIEGVALEASTMTDCFEALEREFVWSAPGRRTAIIAHVQRLLVALARCGGAGNGRDDPVREGAAGDGLGLDGPGRDVELVWRYREIVERRFRGLPAVDVLAAESGVTRSRLDRACRSAASRSALSILHERIMIEAKRALIYTGMTVSEVAASLGFEDPAYFSRFFAARAGCPPSRFRLVSGSGGDSAGRLQGGPGRAHGDNSHTEN